MDREHIASERDQLIITLRERNDEVERIRQATEADVTKLKEEHSQTLSTLRSDYEAQIKILRQENFDIVSAHSQEMDKVLRVETTIDEKQEKIKELEKELGRKNDEIELRREVIDSMSASMMKHEKENRELVSKLVLLKN